MNVNGEKFNSLKVLADFIDRSIFGLRHIEVDECNKKQHQKSEYQVNVIRYQCLMNKEQK
jgi:hypothetical protein